jgi:hypothetical protein
MPEVPLTPAFSRVVTEFGRARRPAPRLTMRRRPPLLLSCQRLLAPPVRRAHHLLTSRADPDSPGRRYPESNLSFPPLLVAVLGGGQLLLELGQPVELAHHLQECVGLDGGRRRIRSTGKRCG